MHFITQPCYAELPDNRTLSSEPIVIHRLSGSEPSKVLVIFVHGLGGSRYGRKSTWQNFPSHLAGQVNCIDIGMYQYETLFKRALFWKSINISEEANVLADIIKSLDEYNKIILIGHSMGGLLCKAVVCHFVTSAQATAAKRISGLVLMATPQAGSLCVPAPLSWLSSDFRALRRHGEFVTSIHEIYINNVCVELTPNPSLMLHIPTWVIRAASDLWVDRLSSNLYLRAEQVFVVRDGHTSIVKPRSETDLALLFVKKCLISCLDNQQGKSNNTLNSHNTVHFVLNDTQTYWLKQNEDSAYLLTRWTVTNNERNKIRIVKAYIPRLQREVRVLVEDSKYSFIGRYDLYPNSITNVVVDYAVKLDELKIDNNLVLEEIYFVDNFSRTHGPMLIKASARKSTSSEFGEQPLQRV